MCAQSVQEEFGVRADYRWIKVAQARAEGRSSLRHTAIGNVEGAGAVAHNHVLRRSVPENERGTPKSERTGGRKHTLLGRLSQGWRDRQR